MNANAANSSAAEEMYAPGVLPTASRAYTRCRAGQYLLVRCWLRFLISEIVFGASFALF